MSPSHDGRCVGSFAHFFGKVERSLDAVSGQFGKRKRDRRAGLYDTEAAVLDEDRRQTGGAVGEV